MYLAKPQAALCLALSVYAQLHTRTDVCTATHTQVAHMHTRSVCGLTGYSLPTYAVSIWMASLVKAHGQGAAGIESRAHTKNKNRGMDFLVLGLWLVER